MKTAAMLFHGFAATFIGVGDVIVVDGKVSEYRSSKAYLYMTELGSLKVKAVLEHRKEVGRTLIGKGGLTPPIKPELYGLDFQESLIGEFITIENPRAVGRPSQHGDTLGTRRLSLSAVRSTAVQDLSNDTVVYNYTYISPLKDESGGATGGNIRVAYPYWADVLQLRHPNPRNAPEANEMLPGLELKYNPAYADPLNEDSSKPLAAATSPHGDSRPPVNVGVEDRQMRDEVTAVSLLQSFISSILSANPSAYLRYILALGDFNEYGFTAPVTDFASRSGERYAYL
ncbi:hypothetical protein F5Y06DRAFT_302785 [Hypoxylon sp. FL0890]|nr:hypothetical protein F5Y06DRAFT_302785 [Hypoxylon sp. FL0890]